MSKLDLSIVIVTYNSSKYIESCLNSIYEKTLKTRYEIIIIDNNSKDNTVDIINEKYKDIILIKNNNNLGFAKAINKGSKIAKGEYLLFLNPDTILLNNTIDIFKEKALQYPQIALFGGYLLGEQDQMVYSCGFLPSKLDILKLYLFNGKGIKPRKININKEQQVEIISGVDFYIKKEVFEKLNGFDEDYFLYHEEVDFCRKLKKNKYKALFVPSAKMRHFEMKSENLKIKTLFYKRIGALLYCLKK
ncbi:MAG: glycosyltransferase family 2 protein [Candidatus Gastranaerophilales bacterium]|nr:glycosyltransferase family 2 protein [Candidatus Gastranaerophilales bacterium]